MRFMVLGVNGMAGHTIGLYLKRAGHDVTGLAKSDRGLVPTVIGDVQDTESLRREISRGRYDAVVNCVGILNADADRDKARACFINSLLPHLLARYADEVGAQVVHLSTDCVFSGKRGGYTEDDLRDGLTFYDRTKALGELEDGRHLTLRTSIVGPDMNGHGIGLLNWFMAQVGEVKGYTRAIWTGQTTLQIAKTVEYGTTRRIGGLYNIVPERAITKFDLLGLFNRYLRGGSVRVVPEDVVALDKSLIRTRRLLDCPVPDYEDMVAEMAAWIRQHRTLYPHYHLDGVLA
jgi:dTDP-4-dehydrorhamnose reductase